MNNAKINESNINTFRNQEWFTQKNELRKEMQIVKRDMH